MIDYIVKHTIGKLFIGGSDLTEVRSAIAKLN